MWHMSMWFLAKENDYEVNYSVLFIAFKCNLHNDNRYSDGLVQDSIANALEITAVLH